MKHGIKWFSHAEVEKKNVLDACVLQSVICILWTSSRFQALSQ